MFDFYCFIGRISGKISAFAKYQAGSDEDGHAIF